LISAITLDLGSTSIKAGLLQRNGELSDIVSQPAPEIVLDGGCFECDALAYANKAEQVLEECLAQTNYLPPLGLCSQRSSFLIWDAKTGLPITPLISWQDTRGAASCEALRESESRIVELTGLGLTPYFLAPKLSVLLRAHPQWRGQLESGKYLVGTLDTFMIWRWTNGKQYITDASMAARTLLMDMRQQQWSSELAGMFGLSIGFLPQIRPSTELSIRLDNGLNLMASMGDQSAAFFSSVGSATDAALVNLGTGGFVMRNLAKNKGCLEGYLRTLLYQDSNFEAHIAIEGTLNSISAALAQHDVSECGVEELGSSEIFCLSEPSGLGAPYFRKDFGIHFSDSIENLASRQVATLLLEGIIFRVARILEDFHCESAIERVYLSGGLSEVICLQQGIASCVSMKVYRLQQKDASLHGAGLLAAGMINTVRNEELIVIANGGSHLLEKYQRWKVWFDDLLTSPQH